MARAAVAALLGVACAFTLDLTFVIAAALAAVGVACALARRPLDADATTVVALGAGIAGATLGDWAIGAPRALAVDLRLAIAVAMVAGLALPRRRAWVAVGAAVLYALGRGAALGVWLTAPHDPVTRTIDETRAPWAQASAAQALFHLVPLAAACLTLGLGVGERRRRDPPLFLFLLALTVLNLAQIKYQALGALLESAGWGLLPSLLMLAVPAGWSLLRRLITPAVGLAVVSLSAALMPPNPRLRQIAVAHDLARLAALVPRVADPAYGVPRASPASVTLAHPVDGVRFAYLAHVAVPALPFWGEASSLAHYQETLALLSAPYSTALEARLDAWRVRYVLTTSPRPSLGLYEQLRIALGSQHPGWPATATLRLVAEAGGARLFERVRGARIRGRARPRETVTVEAYVRAGDGIVFRSSQVTGEDGSFALVVPYASKSDWPTGVATLRLRCPRGWSEIEIADAAVESGGEIVADLLGAGLHQ
jgi:hypothetical protein